MVWWTSSGRTTVHAVSSIKMLFSESGAVREGRNWGPKTLWKKRGRRRGCEGAPLVEGHCLTEGGRPLRMDWSTRPGCLDKVTHSSVLCGADRRCRRMSRVTTLLVQVLLIMIDRWGSKVGLVRVSTRGRRRKLGSVASLGRSSCGFRGVEDKVRLWVLWKMWCICRRGEPQ